MKPDKKYRGVVVPMVTPLHTDGSLDEAAVCRVVDFLVQGGVNGVFVLGTTGEAASVPRAARLQFLKLARKQAAGRALVYAGINDNALADAVAAGNEYLQAGADAIVALLPSYFPIQPPEMLNYFQQLLDQLAGPVIMYNIPATTHHSIPVDVVEKLAGHPRLAGLKDSENNAARLEEVVKKFSGRTDFSVFIGVGAQMAKMMLLGADGIVPSVGNLVPDVCRQFYESARRGEPEQAGQWDAKMMATALLYQRGRTLGQSLAALKVAMSLRGLCGPAMLSPLMSLDDSEQEKIRLEMIRLEILK